LKESVFIIFTGGTIASSINDGVKCVNKDSNKILSIIESRLDYFSYSTIINKNSENFSFYDWMALLDEVYRVYRDGYKRVLILHGTDTMHYSLALLDFYAPKDMSIVFTGSYYTIDDKLNDVAINIKKAVDDVLSVDNGVYLSFASFDNYETVKANLVKPMQFDKTYYESLDKDFEVNGLSFDFKEYSVDPLKKEVFSIRVEPNSNYDFYSITLPKNSIVIFEAYHSGTIDVSNNSLKNFINSREDITFILSLLYNKDSIYQSTYDIVKMGVRVTSNLLSHYIYTVLSVARELNLEESDILKRLKLNK
jgi:L-asparaginase/Glu-tRNA(Gln) amidotransferase subunit D